jgi:hypothetical protein
MRVRADLIENPIEDGGVYLLLATRRPITSDFGKKVMANVAKKLIDLVKQEKNDRLPGLLFDVVLLCPDCGKTKSEYTNSEQETKLICEVCALNSLAISHPETSSPERKISSNGRIPLPVSPGECFVMISFNDRTAGPFAEKLANILTSLGFRAFCTRVYCPTQAGNWRAFTVEGATNCSYYIPLMTDGWQDSFESQFETQIVLNRYAKQGVIIIPFWFDSFDEEYDNRLGHHYLTAWQSIQGVYKDKDPDHVNTLLKLLPPAPYV